MLPPLFLGACILLSARSEGLRILHRDPTLDQARSVMQAANDSSASSKMNKLTEAALRVRVNLPARSHF